MDALFDFKILEMQAGQVFSAAGRIPEQAEFFQDHFPGFPVLPGVLALEILKTGIEKCCGRKTKLRRVENVKFSNYLRPGSEWESRLEVNEEKNGEIVWTARLSSGGKTAVSAKLVLSPIS